MAMVLVLGGARSGKSSFSEKLAETYGSKVIYVATATVQDEEMARRVAHHRFRRPASWDTVEETHYLEKVVDRYGNEADVLLIDCLTMWISNLLLDEILPAPGSSFEEKEAFILERARALAEIACQVKARVILVTNEVGWGLVPDNQLGRAFRDAAGRVNQLLAQRAELVYLVVAGLPIELHRVS